MGTDTDATYVLHGRVMEEFQASHPDGVPMDPRQVVNPQGYCLFCQRQFATADARHAHQQWVHCMSQEEVQGAHWVMVTDDGEPCFLGKDYNKYDAFMSPDHACDIFYNTGDMIDQTTTSDDEAAAAEEYIQEPAADPAASQTVAPAHGQDEERTGIHQLPERHQGEDPAGRD